MPRVLVYGEQDLNLVDGSSVWQASVIEVLAGIPEVEVDVLLRTPVRRRILIGDLELLPNVQFIDPWSRASGLPRPAGPRLVPEEAAEALKRLEALVGHDAILIRSPDVCRRLLASPDVLQKAWVYLTSEASLTALASETAAVLAGCGRVLCQTPEVRDSLLASGGAALPPDRITVLPPMIRPWEGALPRWEKGEPFRLCYSGKFAADYLIEETVAAFVEARRRLPFLEFHVFGDKFHGGEALERRVRAAFASAEGVHWHGAKPRHLVNEALSSCHAGISWRTPAFDDSRELSTKVLEYATLGLPVLLNPAAIQRRVFGDDYPCFVGSSADVVAALERLTSSDRDYVAAQQRVRTVAGAYGFPAARGTIAEALAAGPSAPGRHRGRRALRVLLAGHDLKFATHVSRYFREHRGDRVDVETWVAHDRVSPASDPKLAERADLIWCEWCLGNAVHHARHVREGQRLLVRLHHQEMRLPHRRKIDWQKVDALVSICPADVRELRADLGSRGGIVRYIPNLIDCDALTAPRQPDSEFRLGMLGFSPSMKRPDLALDILEGLRARDRRYSLSLKGQLPWQYPWLWERPEERAYYEQFFARVRATEGVHFDAFGDVTPWLATIGTMLSTSDYEGSHQAVAEGMAAGVVPCIRSWAGADQLYPQEYVFDDVATAVEAIDARRLDGAIHASRCRDHARREFDFRVGYERLDALLADVLG
ncbi:MAG: hypothetical protein ACO3RU_14280 [Planctomycetota bacterium]